MVPADDTPSAAFLGSRDRLRRELLTPITVISGHAGMLPRTVGAAPCLSLSDRARMLMDVAAIEDAARRLCAVVDGADRDHGR